MQCEYKGIPQRTQICDIIGMLSVLTLLYKVKFKVTHPSKSKDISAVSWFKFIYLFIYLTYMPPTLPKGLWVAYKNWNTIKVILLHVEDPNELIFKGM